MKGPDIFQLLGELFVTLPVWHLPSVVIGVVALGKLMMLRRLPLIQVAFSGIAVGIAASKLLHLSGHGVELVGRIPLISVWPVLTLENRSDVSGILPFALPLLLILFAELWEDNPNVCAS